MVRLIRSFTGVPSSRTNPLAEMKLDGSFDAGVADCVAFVSAGWFAVCESFVWLTNLRDRHSKHRLRARCCFMMVLNTSSGEAPSLVSKERRVKKGLQSES